MAAYLNTKLDLASIILFITLMVSLIGISDAIAVNQAL